MYGKIMSLPDHVILTYFELLTDVPDPELEEMRGGLADGSLHPMALKQRLGREIVQQFHGETGAADGEEHFRRVFQDRDFPDDAPTFAVSSLPGDVLLQRNSGVVVLDVVALLAHATLAKSKAEARRLLSQGAVEANGRRLTEQVATLEVPSALKVGKRRFLRIVD
jgi:tyrosyl-tRNA synthetase